MMKFRYSVLLVVGILLLILSASLFVAAVCSQDYHFFVVSIPLTWIGFIFYVSALKGLEKIGEDIEDIKSVTGLVNVVACTLSGLCLIALCFWSALAVCTVNLTAAKSALFLSDMLALTFLVPYLTNIYLVRYGIKSTNELIGKLLSLNIDIVAGLWFFVMVTKAMQYPSGSAFLVAGVSYLFSYTIMLLTAAFLFPNANTSRKELICCFWKATVRFHKIVAAFVLIAIAFIGSAVITVVYLKLPNAVIMPISLVSALATGYFVRNWLKLAFGIDLPQSIDRPDQPLS